ncbi:MAG: hypothetical protein M3178_02775 [Pseudomonadota bacterium]|nr:hypothetical protein [Pseudomonadota bacterium]
MERCRVSSLAWYGAPGRGGLPRHGVIDRRRAMEDRQDAAIETSQGALLPDLSRTRRGEPIKRCDHGEETLVIGRSYNVSRWTISRLTS